MASRGSSGVLESTSPTILNALSGALPPLKKRKVAHVESETSPTSIISIKGHSASLSNNDFTLLPITLLPRSKLPFTWLESSSPIQSGNIFATNNPELEVNLAGWEEPTVLAARLTSNSSIYVVERVKQGIYALSKLQSGIDEGEILVAAKSSQSSLKRKAIVTSSTTVGHGDWRETARLATPIFDSDPLRKSESKKYDVSVVFGSDRRRAAVDHGSNINGNPPFGFLDAKPQMRATTDANGKNIYAQTPPEEDRHVSQLQAERGNADGEEAPAPDVLLDALRAQYLEALYVSKTSVAYFAKGPLTRCRTAFQNPHHESNSVPSGLSNFYRDAILAVKKMDTKYKESIPEIIRNVALVLSDDESRRKKRKSKKKKLGKNGLYSEEDGFIRKWWKDRQLAENAVSADVSRQEEAKRHISDLRLRETQLQILLILETISLEASEGARNGADQAQDEQGSGPKKQRSKKAQDLNVLLELFLDRLCIWHAVSFEDAVVPDSIQESAENHLSGKKIESDMLRDFCTEVIIPFYASRLPEQCKSIKKKLGGPNDISPARPTPQSKPSSRPQPGAAIKRPQPPKQRRTLQRVLTDERAAASHRARQPSLARSSTAPSVQEIKRESVEPSLPSLSGSVRGGIQVARRVDNREVDLNAVAKQHGAKMKKMNIMMKQKKELDAAISALRKPNRELVSKEVAEHAEKRVTSSSARKPKNPVRNPFGQGVQVMATPKGSRKKDISVALPQPRGLARPSMRRADTSPALGSDLSIVPASSTVRPSVSSSAGERREVNSIHETPSRGLSKITDPLQSMIEEAADTPQNAECSRTLFKIPTLPAPRSNDEQQHISTPVRSHLFSSSRTTELPDAGMQETPPRSSSTNLLAIPSSPFPVLDTPVKGGQKRVHTITTPEKSIYDQLGWDDDDLACSL